MRIRSYSAIKAKESGIKIGWVGKIILLRSPVYLHTELQFSEQFRNVSVSATMQDKCKCVRFKNISYSTPVWDTIDLDISHRDEQDIFHWCLDKAGLWKYDLLGLLSHASEKDIIKPHKKSVWCSEFVAMAIQTKRDYGIIPDKTTPTSFHEKVLNVHLDK